VYVNDDYSEGEILLGKVEVRVGYVREVDLAVIKLILDHA
jgi:hypothetical protein